MSGAAAGFTDPNQWKGKHLLENLVGMPMVAGAIGSPKWVKEHPQSAIAAAAIAATVLSAGAAAPAIGAAEAGGGAGAGLVGSTAALGGAVPATEAAAGAGLGEGGIAALFGPTLTPALAGAAPDAGLGGGGVASLFGPTAGESGLLGLGSTTIPSMTSIGTAATNAAGASHPASLLSTMNTSMHGLLQGDGSSNLNRGYQAYQQLNKANDIMNPPHQTMNISKPPGMMHGGDQGLPQYAQISDAPPTTPYSPYDPIWQDWMRRHPQGHP